MLSEPGYALITLLCPNNMRERIGEHLPNFAPSGPKDGYQIRRTLESELDRAFSDRSRAEGQKATAEVALSGWRETNEKFAASRRENIMHLGSPDDLLVYAIADHLGSVLTYPLRAKMSLFMANRGIKRAEERIAGLSLNS